MTRLSDRARSPPQGDGRVERNRVERTINRLKQHLAIATRYEELEETYHALITLAAIQPWLPI